MTNLLATIILALSMVESGGDPTAKRGECVGYLQITPIFVADANRISGRGYSISDRYDAIKSIEMTEVVLRHYAKSNWRVADFALCFKMGIRGRKNPTRNDLNYARRVNNLTIDLAVSNG